MELRRGTFHVLLDGDERRRLLELSISDDAELVDPTGRWRGVEGFSERIVSAPVSPLGQRTRIHTKYATSVALPSTLALDPARLHVVPPEKWYAPPAAPPSSERESA